MALWDEDENTGGVLSEINVVPLIDIMLVLLVLFIVTASVATTQIQVNLAQADAQAEPDQKEPIVVVVDERGDYKYNDQAVDIDTLKQKLTGMHQDNPKRAVQLQADKKAAFDAVGKAMAAIQTSGIENIEVLTEP